MLPPASSNISKNWNMGSGQLRDLVDHITTKSLGRKPAGSVYVGLEHIESGTRNLIGTAPSSVSNSTNGVFRRGDILFGKLRPNLRKAVQVDFGGYCSTDLLVLRPRTGVDNRYAGYVASSEPVFRHAERNSIGTGMPRTSWLAVSQSRVWIPRLVEQRRIAEVLDTIDETIQATERVIAKRHVLRAGLASDLLKPPSAMAPSAEAKLSDRSLPPDLSNTSSNWDMSNSGILSVPLSEIAAFTNGYGFGPADWGKSGLPIVRIQQLLNTDAAADWFAGLLDAKYRIDTGDLIMSWSGTLAIVRWDRGPAWLNQHLFRVDPRDGVDGAFLRHLLISRLGYLEAASHGTTMRHIKRGDLLKHVVVLPPLREQRRIAEVLDTVDGTIQRYEAELVKLGELRAGVATDLLSGRVRTVAA